MISKLIQQDGGDDAFRRERILVIPVKELVGILSGVSKAVLPPEIPSDSSPLRTFQDDATHSVCVVCYHPSFPKVELGFSFPLHTLIVVEATKAFLPAPAAEEPVDDDAEREI